MTGMRSPDGYGEGECLRGAQKKEENKGNALPGEGNKKCSFALKNTYFLWRSPGSEPHPPSCLPTRHPDDSRCSFSSSSQSGMSSEGPPLKGEFQTQDFKAF